MNAGRRISYAQNAEDIVLWRALGHLGRGVYVDVGGYDPDVDSVTRIFYEQGWRGIDVEPVPGLAEKFESRRPGNEVVRAAITDRDVGEVALHWFDKSGLSTLDERYVDRHVAAGWEHRQIGVPARRLDAVLEASALVTDTIHFLKIDVEGAEEQVLRSIDLRRWRPWVLVVEATEPNSPTPSHHAWEPILLGAGYACTLFDGLSRFYVSPDHPELADLLSYPACPFDHYVSVHQATLEARLLEIDREVEEVHRSVDDALAEAARWRSVAAEADRRVADGESTCRLAQEAEQEARDRHRRARRRLKRVRAERDDLRERVRKLRRRVERMSLRSKRMRSRIRELEARDRTVAARIRDRLIRD